MELVFYVYQPETHYTEFKHSSRTEAEKEAERLATMNPGKVFQVLAAVSSCKKEAVSWDRVPVSEIPF